MRLAPARSGPVDEIGADPSKILEKRSLEAVMAGLSLGDEPAFEKAWTEVTMVAAPLMVFCLAALVIEFVKGPWRKRPHTVARNS